MRFLHALGFVRHLQSQVALAGPQGTKQQAAAWNTQVAACFFTPCSPHPSPHSRMASRMSACKSGSGISSTAAKALPPTWKRIPPSSPVARRTCCPPNSGRCASRSWTNWSISSAGVSSNCRVAGDLRRLGRPNRPDDVLTGGGSRCSGSLSRPRPSETGRTAASSSECGGFCRDSGSQPSANAITALMADTVSCPTCGSLISLRCR